MQIFVLEWFSTGAWSSNWFKSASKLRILLHLHSLVERGKIFIPKLVRNKIGLNWWCDPNGWSYNFFGWSITIDHFIQNIIIADGWYLIFFDDIQVPGLIRLEIIFEAFHLSKCRFLGLDQENRLGGVELHDSLGDFSFNFNLVLQM